MSAPEILAGNWAVWNLKPCSDYLGDFSGLAAVQEEVPFSKRKFPPYAGDLLTSFVEAQLQGVEAGVEEL